MNEREQRAQGSGAPVAPEGLQTRVLHFATEYGLSAREQQVLLHVATGAHPKVVGDAIGCAYSSVRTHLRRIYKKSGCSGMRELMIQLFSERHPRSGMYPKG